MRPLRRTILQFSQMRLTLERTFMTQLPLPATRRSTSPIGLIPAGAANSIQIGNRIGPTSRSDLPPIWPTRADTPSGPDYPGTESGDYMRGTIAATSKAAPQISASPVARQKGPNRARTEDKIGIFKAPFGRIRGLSRRSDRPQSVLPYARNGRWVDRLRSERSSGPFC